MIKYILTALYICLTTTGIVLMKLGGNSLSLTLQNGISFKMGYITLLGFLAYLISFLLWQKLLVTFDLSYIVPLTTGICQIVILIIGMLFFHENINWLGIVGVILIIVGVVLLTYGKVK